MKCASTGWVHLVGDAWSDGLGPGCWAGSAESPKCRRRSVFPAGVSALQWDDGRPHGIQKADIIMDNGLAWGVSHGIIR